MKKVIHCLTFLLLFVLCVVFTSCKTTNTTISAGNVDSVGIEVKKDSGVTIPIEGIPILAWWGVQEHTVERYYELKECGIDYNLSPLSNVEDMAMALDAAKTAGIKLLILCPELEKETEKTVNRFKDHPAIAGYHLIDEPRGADLPRWGELARRIQEIDNKHFCYLNLLGSGATPEYYGTANYRKHIQLLLQEVPVQFLSFDYYPIRVNAAGVHFIPPDNLWYESLEIISNEARKAGKSFWAFALTTAHWSYPVPTLSDLRLQVFSDLAYGAQGIQYFTYWTPPSEDVDFHDAPIDNTGKKTATWYTVQQMNMEIKALSNVFLGSQVIQVRHIAINTSGRNEDVPTGTTRFNFAKKPSEARIITKFTPANGTNAVVSFLKNGKRCYMVVINRNLDGGDNMFVTIEGGVGLQIIKKDGTAISASLESSNQIITPGDALIYGWDIK